MEMLSIEMPTVSKCDINKCAYNASNNGICSCHAKAITIGDGDNPGCDTYFGSADHAQNKRRVAGVGACKVAACKHNKDFECNAEKISVGFNEGKINCLTFSPKT